MECNEFLSEFNLQKTKKGKLAGLKISIKDNIAVKDQLMACASQILENYTCPYNATVVEKLLDEGAVLCGKTNMDEFACGSTGESSFFGPTLNPWDKERVAGGTSSGSAVSVALGKVDASIGSDTGGSVRCPAAYCGVFALKPSYGLVSRYGLTDMAMSLDTVSPIAKNVETLARIMHVISGKDDKDVKTIEKKIDFIKNLDKLNTNKIKIGILDIKPKHKIQNTFLDTIEKFKEKGIEIKGIKIPHLEYVIPTYYLIMYSEFASAMQKFDGFKYGFSKANNNLFEAVKENRKPFGKEVKRRIILGTYITMKEYKDKWYSKALASREFLKQEFASVFKDIDFIVTPTMPDIPPKIGELTNPLEMYLNDIFTVSANLTESPAGSVPIEKMIGLQIIGKKFEDDRVLQFMKKIEEIV